MIFIQKRINHTLKTDTRKTFCVIFKKVHLILKNLVEQRTSHTYERTIRMNEKRRIQQQCFKFHFVYFFSSFFHLAQARPCDCVLTNGCDCVCMHTASSAQHSTAQHSTVSVRLLESCVFYCDIGINEIRKKNRFLTLAYEWNIEFPKEKWHSGRVFVSSYVWTVTN